MVLDPGEELLISIRIQTATDSSTYKSASQRWGHEDRFQRFHLSSGVVAVEAFISGQDIESTSVSSARIRSQTPVFEQRLNRQWTEFPYDSGRFLQREPVRPIQPCVKKKAIDAEPCGPVRTDADHEGSNHAFGGR